MPRLPDEAREGAELSVMLLQLAADHGIGPEVAALLAKHGTVRARPLHQLMKRRRQELGLDRAGVAAQCAKAASVVGALESANPCKHPKNLGLTTAMHIAHGYKLPFAAVLTSAIASCGLTPAPGAQPTNGGHVR